MIAWQRVAAGLAVGLPIAVAILLTIGPTHPRLAGITIIVLALLATFIVQSREVRNAKQRVLDLFKERPELDDNAFGLNLFSHEAAPIAVILRKLFQKYHPLSLTRIHPRDAFVKDLQMDIFDSDALNDYVEDVEKEFQIKIPHEDSKYMLTFGQLVDYVVLTQMKKVEHTPQVDASKRRASD